MTHVNPFHMLVVAGVFAVMATTLIVIVAFEKPSCPQGSSQMSNSVTICKAINGE